MEFIVNAWRTEYEESEHQQGLIQRDREEDQAVGRSQKKQASRRHGRFNMHLRREYGNQGMCRLIIQCGRFDSVLLEAIEKELQAEEGLEHVQKPDAVLKWKKSQAASKHRAGKTIYRKVQEGGTVTWNALSWSEQGLWYRYNDGTLLKERNEAVGAYGHGAVFSPDEEVILQMATDRCFSLRVLDALCGIKISAAPGW